MKKRIVQAAYLFLGIGIGTLAMGKTAMHIIRKNVLLSEKHLSMFLLMNQWVKIKQNGKSVAEYFTKHSYKQIAVYGMSHMGGTLVNELKGTFVTVQYGIDTKPDEAYSDIVVFSPDQKLPDVDAIVVTAVSAFCEIEKMLREKVCCPVLSLEEILYEM